MKPRQVLVMLDSDRRNKEGALNKYQPDSKKWNHLRMQIAALEHAIRLVAYEVEKRHELMDEGEWKPGTRKSSEFLRHVANNAPLVAD
ncbi:MAG TPA: hypothetical protein VD994_19945 [Prosthecobacter sp.]|nr:hypothetical protein [Prosthecobacter sp.]